MKENEIARIVVDLCYKIHVKLGPGLLESVYEDVLCYELEKAGISYGRQVPIPLIYEDRALGNGFRADVIVEDKLIVELKSVEVLHPVHPKVVLTYLRLSGLRLGLLVNFNVPLIKQGISRVINGSIE